MTLKYLITNIKISKIDPLQNIYRYNLGNNLQLKPNKNYYYINSSEYNIINISNDIITTLAPIDNDILELSSMINVELAPRSVVRPNVHENCKCLIIYGKWKLGKSESGPCQLCIQAQATYNNKNKK